LTDHVRDRWHGRAASRASSSRLEQAHSRRGTENPRNLHRSCTRSLALGKGRRQPCRPRRTAPWLSTEKTAPRSGKADGTRLETRAVSGEDYRHASVVLRELHFAIGDGRVPGEARETLDLLYRSLGGPSEMSGAWICVRRSGLRLRDGGRHSQSRGVLGVNRFGLGRSRAEAWCLASGPTRPLRCSGGEDRPLVPSPRRG
jgi:hypothetical protein